MRVLGASVLTMEAIVVGFALLIAKDLSANSEIPAGAIGTVIAVLALAAAGSLRSKVGWVLGWVVQLGLLVLGLAVPLMFALGALFVGLWVAAIVVGRKGERARSEWQRRIDSGHHE